MERKYNKPICEPIFNNRKNADYFLFRMSEILDTYGCVTLHDVFTSHGIPTSTDDNFYGWTDLSKFKIVRIRCGYAIHLPPMKYLVEREKSGSESTDKSIIIDEDNYPEYDIYMLKKIFNVPEEATEFCIKNFDVDYFIPKTKSLSNADKEIIKLGFELVETYDDGDGLIYENKEEDHRVQIEVDTGVDTDINTYDTQDCPYILFSESISTEQDWFGHEYNERMGLTYDEMKAFMSKIEELKLNKKESK